MYVQQSWMVWRKRSSIENNRSTIVFSGIYRSIARCREPIDRGTFAIVRDVSSSGKGIPRKKILRYDHFHFLSAQSVENKSGVSYVTKNIMVDVLFTDSIKGADGNTENSFKETIPTGLTLSVDYYRVIIVRPLRTTK